VDSAYRKESEAVSFGRLCLATVFALAIGCTASVESGATPDPGPAGGASGGARQGGSGGTVGMGGSVGPGPLASCGQSVYPGRSPLRRLTRFEYNNTVRDLFGDTTQPATALPAEEIGNGFGNDADSVSVSGLLAEKYGTVAEGIAGRATATSAALAKLGACASSVTAATEDACARTIIDNLAPRAYRRPLLAGESDALLGMEKAVRATANATFATGIGAVIQALLQSPEFLYRVEIGVADQARPTLRRPSGDEMATRLSYLFWGTLPDDALRTAAKGGALSTGTGVLSEATRLLDDPRSHAVFRFFFDNLLPINGLSDLTRDKTLFPGFSAALGNAMHEETQQFLEYEIFSGGGTWPSVLTAPYTFVNDTLAAFYGISGVTGSTFRKVPVPDPTRRLGMILQAGVMTGTITTNKSNPVLRGSFILNKVMCRKISLPTNPDILAMVVIPADTSGATARERFSKHSAQTVCAGCHQFLDPVGFALENFDPIGQYRVQENGVTIDASGSLPGTTGTVNGPVELVQKIASSEEAQTCFASHWLDFGYGRTVGADDLCTQAAVNDAFKKSGYNVKQLLLALTQTDAFLYLPAQ
jgi:Protein of unknown function (DUF1592)/Protein of unknown function (DUF1588)/Protein of unknown function (DUF1587)/Protein of unknown function (DUF1595)/Protein of unknown function (DUF1585)